ncbi:Protein of unknown function [Salinibacillus kushneri]|uniref:DUF3397 domain-containing protein n=1 Tax=Salinibacillus kushneri TaxID=237682 RepID=A0A1I0HPB7_9BACI|nr:DUF3397 domain-containing protein [Salinibacillus kushneri]SET85621.1 Protein of unknown function [Salinibacillus kushneri]
MIDFFAYLAAVLITVPFIVFILCYFIMKKITQDDRRAVRVSADVTTFFLVMSVHFCYQMNLEVMVFGWIVVFLLLFLALFIFLQWKFQEEIILITALKRFWRFSFFIMNILYLVGIVFGIIQRIFI